MNKWGRPDIKTTDSKRDSKEPDSSSQSKGHHHYSFPADYFLIIVGIAKVISE